MSDYSPDELGREAARARAARLVERGTLIQGSLSEYERTCGTPGCRCHHGGPKHSAVYLAIRHDKKRTSVFVPEAALPYVKECVANHQSLQKTLDVISRDCIDVLLSKKRTQKRKKDR